MSLQAGGAYDFDQWLQRQAMSGMSPNPTGFNPTMMAANASMPNPNMGGGLGGLLLRAGVGLQNGLGKMGQGLFPVDQTAAAGMDPGQIQSLRNNAMMKMGLGMMATANQGGRFGESLAAGLGQAQQGLSGAMQKGFENATQARQEQRQTERDKASDQRFDREMGYRQEKDKAALEERKAEQEANAQYRKDTIDLQKHAQQQQMAIAKMKVEGTSGLGHAPAGYRWATGPNGQLQQEIIPGGPADPATGKGKITDTQRLAAAYASRMKSAAKTIDDLDYRPDSTDLTLFTKMSGEPGYVQGAANRMLSPKAQQYFQALQDFSRAKLRKESGAVINKEEIYGDLATFFPLPGDDAATIKLKKTARETALQGMIGAAGPAMPHSASGSGGASAPSVGAVEGGYRFKGGDPSKAENWERE
jgi:hypothetical protein